MTKKTKTIIIGVVGLWLGICIIMSVIQLIRGTDSKSSQDTVSTEQNQASSLDIDGNVIGRWRLTSTLAPTLNSIIVIYEEGDSCYCKETYDSGSSSIKKLRKEGNKYYDTSSTVGEYFLVTNGALRLFDDDGEYGGGDGYSIKTLE